MIKNARFLFFIPGLLFLGLNIFLEYIRYFYFLRVLPQPPAKREIFQSLLVGYALGFITPGNLGNLGKGLYFKNVKKIKSSAIVMVDRVVSMIGTYIFGIVTLYLILKLKIIPFSGDLNIVFSVALFMIAILFFFLVQPAFFLNRIASAIKKNSIKKYILDFRNSVQLVGKKRILIGLILGIFWILVVAIEYFFLINAFIPVEFYHAMLIIPTMLMLKLLMPITLGDLGIREGILLYFFNHLGIPPEPVMLGSLSVFFLNVLIPSTIGIFFVRKL